MENICRIYNLIIIDESGSMDCIKKQTINGFNETIQTIAAAQKKFPGQSHLVTLVSFNGNAIKTIFDLSPISMIAILNSSSYQPETSTPLYDAMGFSLTRLRNQINKNEIFQVLVTIITDGEENASKEFTHEMIKNLVEELKKMDWVFTFIGANIDVENVAENISINNYISFNQTSEGTNDMYKRESKARINFLDKMSKGANKKDLSDDYFHV